MSGPADLVLHARRHWAGGPDPAAGPWIEETELEAPWTGVVRYRFDGDGDVEVEADATGGEFGDTVLFLPEAYWPVTTRPRLGAVTADNVPVVWVLSHTDGALTFEELSVGGGGGGSGITSIDTDTPTSLTGILKGASGTIDTATAGTDYYNPGGTDVAVADGGTGASTASAARTNLGLVIGTDVEAHDADLTTIAGLSPTNNDFMQRKAGAWTNRTVAQVLTDLAAAGTTFQPLDSDLTAIAALTTTSYGRALLTLADLAALYTALAVDTDGTLAANSDAKLPSQQAVKEYVDANVLAGGISAAIVDAKGDLIAATAADTVARVAVGSDGQVLTADSGATPGVSWTTLTGGPPSPGITTGQTWYYVPPGTTTTIAHPFGRHVAFPVYLPAGIPIDRIGVGVTAAGTGANLRFGIYADSNGIPGALLVDSGQIASGTGAKEVTISYTTPSTGWYWLSYVAQSGSGAPTVRGLSAPYVARGGGLYTTFTTAPNSGEMVGYQRDSVTGSLPDPFGTAPLTLATTPARVFIRVT